MKAFLQYVLGTLLVALSLALALGAVMGSAWSLGFLALFFAVIAARDAWQLLALERWLLALPNTHEFALSGGTWHRVFGRSHSLLRQSRETQEQLREALERFQHAATVLPIGITLINRHQRISWCNPSAERHLGISVEQDRGQSLTYLIRDDGFAAFLEEHPPSKPFTLRRVRGVERALSLQWMAYSNSERLLVSHDISALECDERIRQDFVANVSHELRTPLTVVGGYIETLLDDDSLSAEIRIRALQTMHAQTERMRRLVEELLTLSHLESQHTPAAREPIPVQRLLQQTLQLGQNLSQERQLFSIECNEPAELLGIESELQSAFGNLVSNAVRYTPSGGSIHLCWQLLESGAACFSVRDTGIGIAAAHLPRLGERFYRVDRARSRESGGTGLGLAIVKQVAIHHDAKLHIVSEPGKGSCFALEFPLSRIRCFSLHSKDSALGSTIYGHS